MNKYKINIGGRYEINEYEVIVDNVLPFGQDKVFVYTEMIGWQERGDRHPTFDLEYWNKFARWLPSPDDVEDIKDLIKDLEL